MTNSMLLDGNAHRVTTTNEVVLYRFCTVPRCEKIKFRVAAVVIRVFIVNDCKLVFLVSMRSKCFAFLTLQYRN